MQALICGTRPGRLLSFNVVKELLSLNKSGEAPPPKKQKGFFLPLYTSPWPELKLTTPSTHTHLWVVCLQYGLSFPKGNKKAKWLSWEGGGQRDRGRGEGGFLKKITSSYDGSAPFLPPPLKRACSLPPSHFHAS